MKMVGLAALKLEAAIAVASSNRRILDAVLGYGLVKRWKFTLMIEGSSGKILLLRHTLSNQTLVLLIVKHS